MEEMLVPFYFPGLQDLTPAPVFPLIVGVSVIALFLSIPRYAYVILLSRILVFLGCGPFGALEHALIKIFCCYLCLTLVVERLYQFMVGTPTPGFTTTAKKCGIPF